MAGFPSIIPRAERQAVGARRFGDYAASRIPQPLPQTTPDLVPFDEQRGFDPGRQLDYGGFLPEAPPDTGGFMPTPTIPEANNGVNLAQPAPTTPETPMGDPWANLGPSMQADAQSLDSQATAFGAWADDQIAKLTTSQGSAGAVPEQEAPLDRQAPDQPPNPPFTRLALPGLPGMALPVAPVPPKPVAPDEQQQENVRAGRAPFQAERPDWLTEKVLGVGGDLDPSLTRAVGAVGGFLGQQGGQTQPASVMDAVIPEEKAGQIVRRAEARGGYGSVGGTVRAAGEAAGSRGGGALPPAAAQAAEQADEVKRLRLDKFPENVRDDIAQAAEDGNYWRRQRRGVIPDARAEELADRMGRTVDQMIAGGKAGKAYNTEQTRGIRNALVAQAVKVQEIAEQIASDPTGAPPRLIAEQVAEGLKLSDLSRVAEGARAEAGRSLRAYRAFARDFAANPEEAVQRIYRAAGSPEQAMARVTEFTRLAQQGADPFQMGRFWARVEKPPPGFDDWFTALRYNAMLSGPRTLMVNTLGNAAEIPWRGVRDVGASLAKGRPEEIPVEALGVARGFQRGLGAALETLKHGVTAEQAVAGELPRSLSARLENPAARGAALFLEAPGRVMQATDELFRQTAFGMALGRQSAIAAGNEGLRGRALIARADELFNQPTAGMLKTALAVADRMTYKGDMGLIGSKLQGIQQIPILGNVLVPFLKTVYHITGRGIDRSPVGFLGTAADVLRGAYRDGNIPKGAAPLGERIPDNVAGLLGGAALYYLASSGLISGAGSRDPEVRDMQRAQGWQPYSIKIGDKWVGYQQFGPMAIPLSLAAAAAEAPRYRDANDTDAQVALDALRRSAQILAEQPYLQGVGAIYKGMSEPDRYGERWLEQFMQTLVPYGAAINTAGQVLDPVQREPQRGDILGALQARVPGLREQLPAREDIKGRPMPSEQAGLGALFPVRTSTERPDPMLRSVMDAGAQLGDLGTTVDGIRLTPQEQRDYQRARAEVADPIIAVVTAQDYYKNADPATKKKIMEAVLRDAAEEARYRVLSKVPGPDLNRRAQEGATVGTPRR